MELYNYGLAQSATPMDCSAMTVVLSEVVGVGLVQVNDINAVYTPASA